MKLAILGGSFNPVHLGHLSLAEEVRARLALDHILFIPSNIPAHKEPDTRTGTRHRFKMLELAASTVPWILLDDCEIKRGGVSYSIETVEDCKKRYKIEGKPGLIIGDDLVEGFSTWKRVQALYSESQIIIVHRKYEERLDVNFPHVYIDNCRLCISSRDIRERVKMGRPFRFLVPEAVYSYIISNGLYKD
ncbi:MAG: nicotinate (nicotinamide) nucleotide adenylyltransferase [Spirochaetota bacterium]